MNLLKLSRKRNYLKKEVPNDTKTYIKVSIWISWCAIKVVTCKATIKVFGLEKDSGLANFHINKEV